MLNPSFMPATFNFIDSKSKGPFISFFSRISERKPFFLSSSNVIILNWPEYFSFVNSEK